MEKFVEYISKNWLKIGIGLIVAVVLVLIIRSINKKRRTAKEAAQTILAIENAGGKPAELSEANVKAISKAIHDAVSGPGTDTEALVAAVESIPTAMDYYRVKQSYAKEYSSDMWQDIKDDVDPNGSFFDNFFATSSLFEQDDRVAWGKINSHLNIIAVPENLR